MVTIHFAECLQLSLLILLVLGVVTLKLDGRLPLLLLPYDAMITPHEVILQTPISHYACHYLHIPSHA